MPSMLGLTTDKSPYAMDQSNMQLQTQAQGHGALTGGVSRGSPNGSRANGKKNKEEKKPKPPKSTIFGRNHAAAIESETILWHSLCDDPESALEYIAPDAAIVNPFIFGGDASPKANKELKEALADAEPWLACKIHDPTVVEIDLMAVAILYKATLFRQANEDEGQNGLIQVEASGGSSWRQTAAGDWRLTSMHVASL